jgi:hypothetical protein
MANHGFGAKLLTRIVLPDLAEIGEDRNGLDLGFRFQITDGQVAMRVNLVCGPSCGNTGHLGNCPSDGQTGSNQPWRKLAR